MLSLQRYYQAVYFEKKKSEDALEELKIKIGKKDEKQEKVVINELNTSRNEKKIENQEKNLNRKKVRVIKDITKKDLTKLFSYIFLYSSNCILFKSNSENKCFSFKFLPCLK